MELRIDIDYNQILRLIHQLPKREIEQLADTLQKEIESKRPHNRIQEIILKAPTWDDTELNEYNIARNHLNNSRMA